MSPELAVPNDTPAQPAIEIEPEAMRVYVAPTSLPPPTQHPTFELETVRVSPEVDPRRAPTILLPRRQPAVAAEPVSFAPAVSSPRPTPPASAAVSLWLVAALAGLALVAGSAAARMILVYAATPHPSPAVPAAVATVTDELPSASESTAASLPSQLDVLPASSSGVTPPASSAIPTAPSLSPSPSPSTRRAGGRVTPVSESASSPRSTRRIF